MSPEQVQSSRDVDHRTDLWSLGCVLYAALAGRAPYQHHGSLGQLFIAICTSPAPPLAEVAPWLPPEIVRAVHGALEIDPGARYASAAAMLDALRPLVASTAISEEMLVPAGERARPVPVSGIPPSPARITPRIVVAAESGLSVRGDAATQQATPAPFAMGGSGTLASWRSTPHAAARSGVPAVGANAGARVVIVDPRRLLGEKSELWSFSLDVHRDVASLVARIWRSLRRAGAHLPPMTYGTMWELVEPRTGRSIAEAPAEGAERPSLEAEGILPGMVLWVVPVAEGGAS
jgi:hypothetical protein